MSLSSYQEHFSDAFLVRLLIQILQHGGSILSYGVDHVEAYRYTPQNLLDHDFGVLSTQKWSRRFS